MEGEPPTGDERFAEWYVWAKREVSTDNRVCMGAAQAAIEALENGADEQAAQRAARSSTAGHGVGLASRITPRRRAYAEWYDWARRELGGGREPQHRAVRAALQRLDAGADATDAAAAARAAVGMPAPPPPGGAGLQASASASPYYAQAPQAPQPAYPVVASPTAYAPYPGHAVQPPPPDAPGHVQAGFWRRVAAWLTDTILLSVGLVVLLFVGLIFAGISLAASGQDVTNDNVLGVLVALLLIEFVLAWLYYAGLESSAWQGTVGKRLMRLAVTDLYGRRIGFGTATGRYFGKIVSGLPLFVGYLMIAFSERKQSLHDLMAGTLVVRRQYLAQLTAPSAPRPEQSGQPDSAGEVQGA